MRRSRLDVETIGEWENLNAAFQAARRGRAISADVIAFEQNLQREFAAMRDEISSGRISVGTMKSFWIRDPKLRLIHAPCFRDRVLHHALMAHAGPQLERALIDDTYACRVGKGTLAAILRCQHHARRYPVFAKIDISRFFPSIDHGALTALLARRFKNRQLLEIFAQIIRAYAAAPGKGLPIGALTSQHFANYYLAGLDRLILEERKAKGLVRYMDDIVWWGETREEVCKTLFEAKDYAREKLQLEFKPTVQIGDSRDGLMFCGMKILPGALRLSRRRRKRYAERRKYWEGAYSEGLIDARGLQAGYDSALAITAHADAAEWRRAQLRRRPVGDALLEV